MAPTLEYFACRGRGEVLRLLWAQQGIEYKEVAINYEAMKAGAGSAAYPFGQSPLVHLDNGLVLAQMDTILRYFARENSLYGSSNEEAAFIDMFLGGVEDVRGNYVKLIYEGQLQVEAKQKYQSLHIDPSGVTSRNGGAHFRFLENLLIRNREGLGFAVGENLTIADLHLFDLMDLHLREALFPTEMKANFPVLVEHHRRIGQLPNITTYLLSDKRPQQVNGNPLG
jgi:glutathione S-transferase